MTDPSASSPLLTVALFASSTALLGPLLGPTMLVVIASAVGAFIAAAEGETNGVRDVVVYVLRGAFFAMVLAAIMADWVERNFGLVGHSALAGASGFIGYYAHRVRDLVATASRILAGARALGSSHRKGPEE